MKQQKTSLNLIGWDGKSDDGNNRNSERNNDTLTADNSDPSSNSDCPVPLPNFKGIKISPSDIPKLQYNSTVAQYNNWLIDLKTAFDGDPAKFSTSCQKIILASITLDEQLKTTYNSATNASPILSQHWCKFKQWLCEVVIHRGSNKLKLSTEFTAACQTIKADPNQFYVHVSNSRIQSA